HPRDERTVGARHPDVGRARVASPDRKVANPRLPNYRPWGESGGRGRVVRHLPQRRRQHPQSIVKSAAGYRAAKARTKVELEGEELIILKGSGVVGIIA